MKRRAFRTAGRGLAATAGIAAASYAAYVALTWMRYGTVRAPTAAEADPLLDRFMPRYDVVERHQTAVNAPAAVTFAAAREMDLNASPLVRAIFKGRELILGADPDPRERPHGIVAEVRSLGWGVLAEVPDREIVLGAVTRPWEANVTFHALSPEQFAAFDEPGFVKIAWNLRADPVGGGMSIFRTETRAVATDATARTRFRRYWAFLSPGIALIRWSSLGPLRRDAARRAKAPVVEP